MSRRIYLTDDGTFDTMLRCRDCGEEFRLQYDEGMTPGTDDDQSQREQDALDARDAWIEEQIEEIEAEHDCDCYPDRTPKYPRRKMTRTERLQSAADAGYDTWEEYRGEK